MMLVPVVFFWVPNRITEARWLSKTERDLMATRIEFSRATNDPDEAFSWTTILACLRDWKLYAWSISQFGNNTTLYGLTTFMPKIIAGLGFADAVNSQLLTIPVYALAAISYIIMARLSDRQQVRSTYILFSLCSFLLGYIILIATDNAGARYFGVFCLAAGIYGVTTLNILWMAGNYTSYYKRAFSTAFMQTVGNSAGAAVGFVFTAQQAPRYIHGMWFAFGMTVLSISMVGCLRVHFWRENQKREGLRREGARDEPALGERNPHFRNLI